MRSIFRVALVTTLTTACFGTVALASASAAVVWTINGVEQRGGGKENVSSTGGKFTLNGGGIEIECKKESGTGTITFSVPGTDAGTVEFGECALLTEKAACVLAAETLPFEVKTMLTEITGTDYDLFTPKNAGFTTFKLNNVTGKTCSIKGNYAITGSTAAQIGAQAVELEFKFSEAISTAVGAELKIIGKAVLTGSFKEKMTGANIGSELGTF
jgi:hypothetical protein